MFDRFPRGTLLYEELRGDPSVEALRRSAVGFKMSQDGARVLITDLRMGQEPFYTFNFVVAERHSRGCRCIRRFGFRTGWTPTRAAVAVGEVARQGAYAAALIDALA